MIKANKACSFNYDINNYLSGSQSNDNDDRSKQAWSPSNKSLSANVWTRVWFSYTAKANVPITESNSNFGIVNNTEAITVEIKEVMVAKSNVPVDYQTPDADFEAKVSELKQTTDAITASVSALDNSTVKNSSLTINSDGIVMKAGKSTNDIANAIGSYFSVNQNAINLFSDKINVKGSMIVDGAITSTKIAAGAITADKIQAGSITADMFKGNQITSLNGATTLNLSTGEIIFNNQYATISQIKGSYKSQISLFSLNNGAVNESAWSSVNTLAFNSTKLTSATRRAGSTVDMFPDFSLMTLYGEKIAFTGETSGAPESKNAIIVYNNTNEVNFTNSQTNSSKGAWNYSMIMNFGDNAAISAPDIKLAGHFKSLTGILDDLCKKVGILWI